MTKSESWESLLALLPALRDESKKVMAEVSKIRLLHDEGYNEGLAAGDAQGYARGMREAKELFEAYKKVNKLFGNFKRR